MQLNLQSFNTLVQNSAAAVQSACSSLLNLSVGSVTRALIEAWSSVALWLQYVALQVLSATRLATSIGTDVDSFVADYGLTRLPATQATGAVTFSRYSNTSSALISLGALVKTTDGSQSFLVTMDVTNAAWNATLQGYSIAGGVSSVTVPVQAVTAGTGGNVQSNTITLIGTAISSVDTVTNALAFTNALNVESDAALKVRFAAYVASLPRATLAAIGYAISSVQQTIYYQIVENYNHANTYTPGYFTVYIDDGTGSPSGTLLANVGTAVEAYRGASITYGVFGPTVLTANVAGTITVASGYTGSAVKAAVAAAWTAAINATGMGSGLTYAGLFATAFGVAGVTNVTSLTLNSATSDLAGASGQVIRAGTVTAS